MLRFNRIFDKLNFDGGQLSSDGGAILMLKFLESLHLEQTFESLPFRDSREAPIYSNQDILMQLLLRCILGYFTQKDQSFCSSDPLLSRVTTFCSQPTVSRFFDRVSVTTNMMLKEAMTKQACEYINKNITDPIIDADSTLVNSYGKQEASAYIYHYKEIGYHPLVINEFKSGLLLSSQLRTGSSYSSNGIIEELESVLTFLNADNISFRGDSAFYDTDLMDFLEQHSVDYYIRCKNYHILYSAVEKELSKLENPEQYTAFKPYFSEISYSIAKKKERRIVYKAYWVTDKNEMTLFPTIYAVVTNNTKMSPREVMAFYEKRGASENFTKELKNDFNGGTLSHQRFEENEIQFLISSLAYNVYHFFQNDILDDDDKKMTMNSYRLKFQKIAVRVIRHAREVVLSFSSSYRHQNKFLNYWNTVLQL